MKVTQLRKLLEAFTAFAQAGCNDGQIGELQTFTTVLPKAGDESTADFVKRIRKNLIAEGRPQKSPRILRVHIECLASALEVAQAKTSHKDVKLLLTLFDGNAMTSLAEFIEDLTRARDYVVPAKPRKTPAQKRGDSAPDQVVTRWVDNLNSSLFSPAKFSVALDTLRNDSKISDTRVKKITKMLSGKSAKTREGALEILLQHQNKQALSRESADSLEHLRP